LHRQIQRRRRCAYTHCPQVFIDTFFSSLSLSLSLSLFFQNINLAQCAVYCIHEDYICIHTHSLYIYVRFFGPPNTQSDTELFIGKLHRTSASGIYILLLLFFIYIFILFVLKIPPLRCARIILSCITLNVTVSLLYICIYKCMVYGYIYIIYTAACSSRARSRWGFILRARVAIVHNNIYDVYTHENVL